jgi:hypothetical protein
MDCQFFNSLQKKLFGSRKLAAEQGCQIFLGPSIPKIQQMITNCTKRPFITPNGHKIYQHFQFQDLPKFTQIGIFGLKRNHLATLQLNELEEYVYFSLL